MKTILAAIVIQVASVFALAQEQPIEKGWKNIKLFESKRSDLEKTLGKGYEGFGGAETTYGEKNEPVWVFYSKGPCAGTVEKPGYNIEKDTVTSYTHYFFKDMPLTELKWNPSDYSRDPSGNAVWYTNKKQGIVVVTIVGSDKEWVALVGYGPTEEQKKKYLCP
jgi:hypothetical protein